MSTLDPREIPPAGSGLDRDAFELFVREFLMILGLLPAAGPDRGADGGRDLLMVEERQGTVGSTRFVWLVSCKHKAHGGAAVGPRDEEGMLDRVRLHDANGFMGFYSTLPSSGFAKHLDKLKQSVEVETYDWGRIERELLDRPGMRSVVARYLPNQLARWQALRESDGAASRLRQAARAQFSVLATELTEKGD